MLEVLSRRARAVSFDAIQGQGLHVVPIVGPSHARPDYEVLRPETLKAVSVTEISDAGSVPNLRVQNTLDKPVYVMDGQELVGAKQNRILNTDVMVPAHTTVTIPVSCVEQGRWRMMSRNFITGKSSSYLSRHGKSARVHKSLKETKRHLADQSAVWNEVADTLKLCNVASPTGALSDAYAAHDAKLVEFRQSLRMPETAVGLAVLRGGKVMGIDLFDRHSTLQHVWTLLLDSYAIDFITDAVDPSKPEASDEAKLIRQALDRAAAAKWEAFDPPGLGKDWRLEDDQLVGSALVCGGGGDDGSDDVVVHLQLFPKVLT